MAEGDVLQRELGAVLDHELEQVQEQREIRHPGIILAVSGRTSRSTLRCSKARRIGCWRARIEFSVPTGGLTLASTLRFKELGLEAPGALWAGTPWADLTKTGDSLFTNEGIDRALVSYDGILEGAAKLYADGRDLKTPLISPLYGDFEGFPPTYLVTGTRDLFLSDVVRVHRKMRVAGVVADLNVYEGVSHGDYMVIGSPELQQALGELAEFLLQHLQ